MLISRNKLKIALDFWSVLSLRRYTYEHMKGAMVRMVSIKTIAEECGVSIATVSKALNNHSDVSGTTKKLVCDTAKKLGYFPNAQARALKTNKTFNIGVLLQDKAHSGLTHNFFSAVVDSFRVEVEKRGYDITFICGRIGGNVMSYLDHCMYRSVDGVIAACVDFYDREIVDLLKSNIPVVTIDYQADNICSVSSDNVSGLRKIVEYAYECGHSKIAYVYGESSQVTTMRLNSFLDTMKKLGLQVQPDYLRQGKYHDIASAHDITVDMLKLYDKPTFLILPDDFAAIGAMKAAEEAGISIPDDISIAGYDGIQMTQLMSPALTTFEQDTRAIGKAAAELLIRIIRKEELAEDEKKALIGGKFIKGATVKHI